MVTVRVHALHLLRAWVVCWACPGSDKTDLPRGSGFVPREMSDDFIVAYSWSSGRACSCILLLSGPIALGPTKLFAVLVDVFTCMPWMIVLKPAIFSGFVAGQRPS